MRKSTLIRTLTLFLLIFNLGCSRKAFPETQSFAEPVVATLQKRETPTSLITQINPVGTNLLGNGQGLQTNPSPEMIQSTPSQAANPVNPQSTGSIDISSTSTQAQQRSTSLTPIVAVTPTYTQTNPLTTPLPTGWEGEWVAYFEEPDGTYQTGVLSISLQGETIQAVFDYIGNPINFQGLFVLDAQKVEGQYIYQETIEGTFKWSIASEMGIRGNLDNEFGFCAARSGQPMPEPCVDLIEVINVR